MPPAIAPAVHTGEAAPLDRPGARRAIAPAADTLVALPLHPIGSAPLTPAETTSGLDPQPLQGAARGELTLDPLPATEPVLDDAPTFYARGQRDEPDLIGGRAVRAHGAVTYPPGVDAEQPDPDTAPGTAYRGGNQYADGDFHVDTRDGWASTATVSYEAWINPATLRGDQSLLDARTVHWRFGDRWLWTVVTTLLGVLVTTLADILGDYDVLDDWPRWRNPDPFGFWRVLWHRDMLRWRRHHMGWELEQRGDRLVASFGNGLGDAAVAADGVLTAGRWTHVAATCDGDLRRLYVDGALVATSGGTPTTSGYIPPVPGVDLVIGRGTSGRTAAAAIDDVAVFDYVLTPAQVAAHHAGIGAGLTRGLPDTLRALPLRPAATRGLEPADATEHALAQQPDGSYPITPAAVRVRALPLPGYDDRDAALGEALAAELRRPVYRVRADWDGDHGFGHALSELTGVVEEITIDRTLAGDLPAEVGLVEGAASAALTLRLAGQFDTGDAFDGDTGVTGPAHRDSLDVLSAFAPYNPDAALYGQPMIGADVEVDTGLLTRWGRDLRRRFTGTVSRVNPSSAARDVEVGGLDGANGMHAPITLPAMGMDGFYAARYGSQRYNARTNSQWLVDLIFRANGVYASPPPQPGAFISATMHGSSFPELGAGGVPKQGSLAIPSNPDAWATEGHPHKMLYPHPDAPPPAGMWTSPQVLTMQPGDGFGCSFLARMPPDPVNPLLFSSILDGGPRPDPTDHFAVLVELYNGAPSMIVYTPGGFSYRVADGQWTRPSEPEWHHIGMHWAFGPAAADAAPPTAAVIPGTATLTIAIDGENRNPVTVPINVGPVRGNNPWAPSTAIEYNLGVPVTNVCWFSSPIAPYSGEWFGPGHIPQADIDPGMNEWTGIRQISGEDSWELLTEVTAAEAAVCGFTPAGRGYFRSRAVTRTRGDEAIVSSTRELADLVVVTDEASVRNSVTASTQPCYVGGWEWVVDAQTVDQFEAGPGATLFPITLPPDTVLVEPYGAVQMNRPAWEEYADLPYFSSVAIFSARHMGDLTLQVPFDTVSMLLYPQGPGRMVLAIYNTNEFIVQFATEDYINQDGSIDYGSAAFRIPGRLLADAAVQPYNVQDAGSVALFGPRTFDLGGTGNRWHQFPRAIRGVAESILTQTAHPAPVLDSVSVPHDPRRDLADPVRLTDPTGLGSLRGTVTGITTSLAAGQAVLDELTVRPLMPPGFGLFDDAIDGRVGETLRFGP